MINKIKNMFRHKAQISTALVVLFIAIAFLAMIVVLKTSTNAKLAGVSAFAQTPAYTTLAAKNANSTIQYTNTTDYQAQYCTTQTCPTSSSGSTAQTQSDPGAPAGDPTQVETDATQSQSGICGGTFQGIDSTGKHWELRLCVNGAPNNYNLDAQAVQVDGTLHPQSTMLNPLPLRTQLFLSDVNHLFLASCDLTSAGGFCHAVSTVRAGRQVCATLRNKGATGKLIIADTCLQTPL